MLLRIKSRRLKSQPLTAVAAVFSLSGLDEEVMGGLLMHYMLETILTANLLGVNAFDQPAVEEGKILTRAYLKSS